MAICVLHDFFFFAVCSFEIMQNHWIDQCFHVGLSVYFWPNLRFNVEYLIQLVWIFASSFKSFWNLHIPVGTFTRKKNAGSSESAPSKSVALIKSCLLIIDKSLFCFATRKLGPIKFSLFNKWSAASVSYHCRHLSPRRATITINPMTADVWWWCACVCVCAQYHLKIALNQTDSMQRHRKQT